MALEILKVFAIVCVAFVCGKIISKIKMPAILGWLIAGIVFGPYLVGLVDFTIIESGWYENTVSAFECRAGLMIGFAVGIAITAGLLMRKKIRIPFDGYADHSFSAVRKAPAKPSPFHSPAAKREQNGACI